MVLNTPDATSHFDDTSGLLSCNFTGCTLTSGSSCGTGLPRVGIANNAERDIGTRVSNALDTIIGGNGRSGVAIGIGAGSALPTPIGGNSGIKRTVFCVSGRRLMHGSIMTGSAIPRVGLFRVFKGYLER